VLKRLTGEGFIPYRLAAPAMGALPESDGAYGRMLRQLKEALDPGGILAPGRYDLQWTPAPAAEPR
jgi:4-cresol dehydrogenase (hydroxylating)